jgi:hypothetical protein
LATGRSGGKAYSRSAVERNLACAEAARLDRSFGGIIIGAGKYADKRRATDAAEEKR